MYHVTRSPKFKQEGSTGLYIKLNWEQIERMLMKAIRKINFIYFKCKQDQGVLKSQFEHQSNYIKSINAQVNKIYWANAESKGLNFMSMHAHDNYANFDAKAFIIIYFIIFMILELLKPE